MATLTLNGIFNRVLDKKILRTTEGKYEFNRKEKLSAVLPGSVVAYVTERSSSYLSWFLNDDKQGDSVRKLVGNLFDRDPLGFMQETVSNCGSFLDSGDGKVLPEAVWDDLLDALGRSNPLFIRNSSGASKMKEMVQASTARVLAVLVMDAATGGLTPGRYEKLLSCWHLMDRNMVAGGAAEPQKAARAGQILYVDGNRKAALQQFKKAVELLETSNGEIKERDLLMDLLLRMGNMYLQGDGCETDRLQAARNYEKSAELGCAEADFQLALMYLQDGFTEGAKEAFRRGSDRGNSACLRMMGNAFYAGDVLADGRRDLAAAQTYFLRGARPENPAAGDPFCQYMLGCILEEDEKNENRTDVLTGKEADPEYWYEAAARGGNHEAASRLNRRRWHRLGSICRPASNTAEAQQAETEAHPGKNETDSHSDKRPSRRKYCILTSFSGGNKVFAESLPAGEYTVLICNADSIPGTEDPMITQKESSESLRFISAAGNKVELYGGSASQMLRIITDRFFGMEKAGHNGFPFAGPDDPASPERTWDTFPEILLLALGENERDNVSDGLQILSSAFLIHEEIGAWVQERYKDLDALQKDKMFYLLSDRLRLYVLGKEKVIGPVFDSACSRMGDFYIPLLLCDRTKMASMCLLERMPLFLPYLQTGDRRIDTVIFGDHPGIIQLCKDAIAAAQIDDIPFSLTVVGENADSLERVFRTECPGIANPSHGVSACMPVFIRMQPESETLQELLAVDSSRHSGADRELEDDRIATILQSASYLIVYTADEDRNLSLAMYLREWYLSTDPSFSRLPFIAAYCENSGRAEQVRTLSAGAEESGFSWFNNYNIESFGMENSLFSYSALMQSRLERQAMASHFSYYVNAEKGGSFFNSFEKETDRFRAEHDYYSRNYNRDSSLVNALALPYRLFSSGITFRDWHAYAARISFRKLAEAFEEWLKADGDIEKSSFRLEVLAMQEHGRWNRTMLSRGWRGATPEQMQTYIQRGCSRHQLYIARLHPFICSWDQLGDTKPVPSGIQKDYGFIMMQIRPGKEPANIREIDRENVRKTAMLLQEE